MADNDEKLSPEEKLLQVIQGGDPEETSSSDEEAPRLAAKSEPPSDSVAADGEPEQAKPKLKLAKKDELDGPPAVPAASTPAAEAPAAGDAAPPPPPPIPDAAAEPPTMAAPLSGPEEDARPPEAPAPDRAPVAPIRPLSKDTGRRNGVRIANRSLSGAAVAILALVGYELYGTTRPAPPEEAGKVPFVDTATQVEPLPPAVKFQEQFASRNIFELPAAEPTGGRTNVVVDPVHAAIRELDMMGVSPLGEDAYEALVVYKPTGQMHFVRKGQQIPLLKTNRVDVADVRKDYVTISYDGEEIKVN